MADPDDKPSLTDKFISERCAEHARAHAKRASKTRIYYDGHSKAPQGFGVRVTAKGSASFVLNYYAKGAERRATIGAWGERPNWSITAARIEANRLRAKINAGQDPVAEERSAKEAKRAAEEAAKARSVHSLAALVAAYVGDLEGQGKPSAREVQNLFDRAVAVPFPKMAKLPVDAVTVEGVLPALHRLTKADKYRDAEKLASYLRTAFNNARAARTDARGHAYAAFQIKTNPLADLRVTRPKVTAEAARHTRDKSKWTLSQPELAEYWRRIAGLEDAYGAMLRLHLLTGGQRREQLARIERSDYAPEAHTLTLWDGKGRRSESREHVVPLIEEAEQALLAMAGDEGPYLFTVNRGRSAATAAMLDHAMSTVSAQMVEAGQIARTITPGAIRRTAETLLGANGVPLEIRGQLQSHGLGNVQYRHYDMGLYLQPKRDALETWRRLCDPAPDNVTPIKRKAAGAA
jgi:integrase